MFTKPNLSTANAPIDEMQRLRDSLANHEPHTPEYATILDHLVKLEKIQLEKSPKPLSNDTKALIAANFAGLLLVLKHEHANVITSKAFGMLVKAR